MGDQATAPYSQPWTFECGISTPAPAASLWACCPIVVVLHPKCAGIAIAVRVGARLPQRKFGFVSRLKIFAPT